MELAVPAGAALHDLIRFGMLATFSRSQGISMPEPQTRAYHKAPANVARLSNGYRGDNRDYNEAGKDRAAKHRVLPI